MLARTVCHRLLFVCCPLNISVLFLSLDGTLPKTKPVKGKAFGRFIQVWLENTDYNTAASSPTFQKLSKQGITLSSLLSITQYVASTCFPVHNALIELVHSPSEPNYIASMSGDFWGDADDNVSSGLVKNLR